MNDDRKLDEEVIFAAALEKHSAEERAAYLDHACGEDSVLRKSLEELLEAHDNPIVLVNDPLLAIDPAAHDLPLAEGPGERIGRYKLLELIGEGGFGTVFKSVHPLIGKVAAVKVLSRQYSAQPEMVSRFVAEARAVNRYAAAISMPRATMRALIAEARPTRWPELYRLAERFEVTISALCVRLDQLGLLHVSEDRRLYASRAEAAGQMRMW